MPQDFVTLVLTHNTLLSGALLFVLGMWLFYGREGASARREPLAGLLVYAAFWLLSYTLYLNTPEPSQQLYWMRSMYFTASFLPLFIFLLTFSTAHGRPPSQRFQFAVVTLNLALLPLIFVVPSVVGLTASGHLVFGPAMDVVWLHFAVMTAAATALLVQYGKNLRAVLGSGFWLYVVGAAAVLVAVFGLLHGGDRTWALEQHWVGSVAALTALSGLILVVYALDGSEFVTNMRAVGLELFLLVLTIVLILDVVVAPVFVGFSLRLAAVMTLLLYGTLAVRTLNREVQRLRESERMRRELEVLYGRLQASDRLKTRLLRFATHQLRAILSGIRSYLDMLYTGDFGELQPRQKEIAGVTLVATDRLGDTVETFLDVAKVDDGGRLRVDKTETDLSALISRVVKEFAPLASKKGLSLTRDVPDDLGSIICDGGRLYHAIANLIHNAVNYTDHGGVTVVVTRDTSTVQVSVRDTGIGLDEQAREHVQELLREGLEAVRFEESGGSGLGLYITKAIIDAHGGEMTVASDGPRHGSTFGFRIPVA